MNATSRSSPVTSLIWRPRTWKKSYASAFIAPCVSMAMGKNVWNVGVLLAFLGCSQFCHLAGPACCHRCIRVGQSADHSYVPRHQLPSLPQDLSHSIWPLAILLLLLLLILLDVYIKNRWQFPDSMLMQLPNDLLARNSNRKPFCSWHRSYQVALTVQYKSSPAASKPWMEQLPPTMASGDWMVPSWPITTAFAPSNICTTANTLHFTAAYSFHSVKYSSNLNTRLRKTDFSSFLWGCDVSETFQD